MSEFAASKTATGTTATGSTATSTPAHPVTNRGAAISVVHEAYAFACMRCGHGWEQSYEIEHHIDGEGAEFVMYVANGERVPSPLSSPTCLNCGGHVVRIMRSGRVSSVHDVMQRRHGAPPAGPVEVPEPAAEPEPGAHHHWHLSDLLHPFSHHRKDGPKAS
ncbi:hypothetical protein K377_05248 [Streptomyces sp. PsTaAH-137]|jgi:hypothetical protein|uniref:hypothetical protein n=1 Tax=Streptomyces sp. PsTaAH-137 TaxID=1305830 RepID=UPI000DC21973|nr:hypothetical protein K377_05248 [Streptomyces sp. PsTaAH-137]